MRVAIQPCGNTKAKKHYRDTIQNLVSFSVIDPFFNQQHRNAYQQVCGSQAAVWGVTKGKKGQNYTKWSKLRAGDIALLYKDKKIFSVGRIVLTMQNEELAAHLWSRNDDGETWEYMYFLDDIQEIDIDITRYNQVLLTQAGKPYEENNIVQGFDVHEGENAESLLDLLELGPEDAPDEPEVDPRRSLQQQLNSIVDTDHDQKTKARKEMGILREHLFGKNATGHCDICNKELPVGFIVAAHIKPRRDCVPSERKDLNVVMRACRFGCDELFERSYIQVNEKGLIEAGVNLGRSTNDLKKEAMKVIGRETSAFNKETKGYFEWHRNHSKRKLKA